MLCARVLRISLAAFALNLIGCAPGFDARSTFADPSADLYEHTERTPSEKLEDPAHDELGENLNEESEAQTLATQLVQQETEDTLAGAGVGAGTEAGAGTGIGLGVGENVTAAPVAPSAQAARPTTAHAHLDPAGLISKRLLGEALSYFEKHKSKFKNQRVITVVDFSLPSSAKRLFVINMQSGSVFQTYTAHGTGSDKEHDGMAEKFGNLPFSHKSSLGAFLATTTYSGKHGYSLRLHGLQLSNSLAYLRGIILHTAPYVRDAAKRQGRSWGCFVVPHVHQKTLIDTIKGGSLLYAGLSKATAK